VHSRALRAQLRDLAAVCGCAEGAEGRGGGRAALEGGPRLLDALHRRVEGHGGRGGEGAFLRSAPTPAPPPRGRAVRALRGGGRLHRSLRAPP